MVVTILCLTFLLWKKTEAQLSWSPIFLSPVTEIKQSVPTVSDVIIKGVTTYEASNQKLKLLQDSIAKAKFYSNESKIAYMYIDESLRTPAMKNISLLIEKINKVLVDDSGSEDNRRCVQNMLTNIKYIELNGILRGNNCSTSELLMSLHLSERASSIDKDLQFNLLHSGSSAIRKCGDNNQNVKSVETCVDNIIAKNLDFLNTSLNQSNLIIRESQNLLNTKQQCINHLIQVEKDIKDICVDRQTCGAYYDYICLSGKELYNDIKINNTILYSDLFSELVLPAMTLDFYAVGETFIAPTMSSMDEPLMTNQILNLSRFVKNEEEKLTAENFTLSINDNFDTSNIYLFTNNMPSTPTTQVLFNLFGNISYPVENSEKNPSLGATTLVNINRNFPQITTTIASMKKSNELPKDTQTTKITAVLTTDKPYTLSLATTKTTHSGKSTPELPKVTQATTPIPLTTEKPSTLVLTTTDIPVKSIFELPKVTQTTKIPITSTTEKPSTLVLTTDIPVKPIFEPPKVTQTTKIPITSTTEKPSTLVLTTTEIPVKSIFELPKITQTTKSPISLTTETSPKSLTTTTNSWKTEKALPKEDKQATIKTPVTDKEIPVQPIWVQSMMSAFMQIGMTQIDTLSTKLTNLKSDTSSALDELERAESMLKSMGEELIRYSFDNSLSNIEDQIKQKIDNNYTYDVTCTGRSNAIKNFTTTVSKGKETARLCISDGVKKTKRCINKIDSIPAKKPSDFIAWSSTKLSTCKVVEIIKVMSCINDEVTNSEKFLNTIVTGASEVISDAHSLLNEVQMCLDNCLISVVQYVNKILSDLQNCVIKQDQSLGDIKFLF